MDSTGGQVALTGGVFVLAGWCQIEFGRDIARFIFLPNGVAMQFLTAIITSIGMLIAVIFGLSIFQLQGADQVRGSAFSTFKLRIGEIFRLYRARPDEVGELDGVIWEALSEISLIGARDLPVMGKDWERLIGPIVTKWEEIDEKLNRDNKLYCRHLLFLFGELERANEVTGIWLIRVVVMKLLIDSMTRLMLLLFASAILLLLFGSLDPGGMLPDLRLSAILAILVWFALALRQVIRTLRREYSELCDEWGLPDVK